MRKPRAHSKPEQLDLFAPSSGIPSSKDSGGKPLQAPEPKDADEELIDHVLHRFADQWILRRILAGESWNKVAGLGGGCFDRWLYRVDTKGIAIDLPEPKRLITPKTIIARAHQYA